MRSVQLETVEHTINERKELKIMSQKEKEVPGSAAPCNDPVVKTAEQLSAGKVKKVPPYCTQKLFFLAGVPVLQAVQKEMSRDEHPGTGSVKVSLDDLLRVSHVEVV